jgi:CubicO group peptidase (beta-lactamase class C family)
MRHFAFGTFVAAGVVLALPAVAQSPAVAEPRHTVDQQRLTAVVDWLKADVASGRIPGAVVLVAHNGKILLHEAVGWADKDKQIPMTKNSIHPIASATKLVTTVAALRLIEQNKIKIFAPIATYLPELKDLKVGVEKRDATGAVTIEFSAHARG